MGTAVCVASLNRHLSHLDQRVHCGVPLGKEGGKVLEHAQRRMTAPLEGPLGPSYKKGLRIPGGSSAETSRPRGGLVALDHFPRRESGEAGTDPGAQEPEGTS